ncbi:hypothetical protein BIW11_08173 [Tropilaelaps mercedesae]|uniref:mitogen-activated protein kinase kinase n=1 Tax=Tropilaelaps mercedesae TaxID=418985 RepID=A0A1V9XQP5_9ACAR|nr:hypothetical protein BIW11_08173 [Tropilaelaps mercedesae]
MDRCIRKSKDSPTRQIPTMDQLKAEAFLGAGSFGVVYKARFLPGQLTSILLVVANMICTVKVVPVDRFKTLEHIVADRLVASLVDHPCVIRVYAIFNVENASVTLMEYHRGSDLQKVVETTRNLHVEESRLVFAQMVAGLIHMHYCGFMHRDIKGSNTLVSQEGRVKLIDFDTAKVLFTL